MHVVTVRVELQFKKKRSVKQVFFLHSQMQFTMLHSDVQMSGTICVFKNENKEELKH